MSVAFWHRTTAGKFLSCPYLPRRNRTVNGKTRMKFLPEQPRGQTVQKEDDSPSSVLYRERLSFIDKDIAALTAVNWHLLCCQ